MPRCPMKKGVDEGINEASEMVEPQEEPSQAHSCSEYHLLLSEGLTGQIKARHLGTRPMSPMATVSSLWKLPQ